MNDNSHIYKIFMYKWMLDIWKDVLTHSQSDKFKLKLI